MIGSGEKKWRKPQTFAVIADDLPTKESRYDLTTEVGIFKGASDTSDNYATDISTVTFSDRL
jgi:hypothetical protein